MAQVTIIKERILDKIVHEALLLAKEALLESVDEVREEVEGRVDMYKNVPSRAKQLRRYRQWLADHMIAIDTVELALYHLENAQAALQE